MCHKLYYCAAFRNFVIQYNYVSIGYVTDYETDYNPVIRKSLFCACRYRCPEELGEFGSGLGISEVRRNNDAIG